jgi:transglutaminase-like putative cysteine protease
MIQLSSRHVVPRIQILRVPKGTQGTLATAGIISRLIQDGAKDFYVRQKAIEIFRAYGVRPKNRLGEVCALFDFVRRNIRYTRDIFRVELLHSARRMLELRAGDCDDMTILLGSMLISTGHPVRLVLAGFRRNKPHCYTHIYPEVRVGHRWVAIDATVDKPMGWAPPALWKRICEIKKETNKCSTKHLTVNSMNRI